MAPGMIMDRDTSADAMRDMAAAQPRLVTASYGPEVRGDQGARFRMDGDVKVFDLKPSVNRWAILPSVTVEAYAYNGQIPGPRIRIKQGDKVRINVSNALPEETTIHWHGLILPNQRDGPAEITQKPIEPGESYSYEFTADLLLSPAHQAGPDAGLRARLEIHGWAFRRSRLPPIATRIMAFETSMRAS